MSGQPTLYDLDTPVTIDGVTKSAREWAKERGLREQLVKDRRAAAKSWEESLSPIKKQGMAWRRDNAQFFEKLKREKPKKC